MDEKVPNVFSIKLDPDEEVQRNQRTQNNSLDVILQGTKTYQGANDRPNGSLEQIFTGKRDYYNRSTMNQESKSTLKIQSMYRYWMAPRLRAMNYNPLSRPTQKTSRTAPGSTRLPGYEISSREAAFYFT